MPLNWFLLITSLSEDNLQEEPQEVVNVLELLEAMDINLFQDKYVCAKWNYNTHGPFNYVQLIYFLAHIIKPEDCFDIDSYPSL